MWWQGSGFFNRATEIWTRVVYGNWLSSKSSKENVIDATEKKNRLVVFFIIYAVTSVLDARDLQKIFAMNDSRFECNTSESRHLVLSKTLIRRSKLPPFLLCWCFVRILRYVWTLFRPVGSIHLKFMTQWMEAACGGGQPVIWLYHL